MTELKELLEFLYLARHTARDNRAARPREAAEQLLAWRTGEEGTVTVNGQEARVIGGSDRMPGPPLEVHLVRGGTHIRVYSNNLDETALLEIAGALEPAPTEQPPLIEG